MKSLASKKSYLAKFISAIENCGIGIKGKRILKARLLEDELKNVDWRIFFLQSIPQGRMLGIEYSIKGDDSNERILASLREVYQEYNIVNYRTIPQVLIDNSKRQVGGKREGAGRKFIGAKPRQLSLDDETISYLKRKGNGNASLGVRLLVQADLIDQNKVIDK